MVAAIVGLIAALLPAATIFTVGASTACAQTGANSDPNYLALRNITLRSEAVSVTNFVNTYRGKAATTEDFKAIVEKHMTPDMDAEGNHTLDWFFNEYVYGTQLPSYKLDYSFDTGADGTIVMSLNVTQSGVDDKFRMVVPVYLELDDGRIFSLGRMRIVGNKSETAKVALKGIKAKPRRAMINYYDDVLASPS